MTRSNTDILRSTRRHMIRPAASIIDSNRRQNRTISYYTFPPDIGKHSTVLNLKRYDFKDTNTVNVLLRDSIVLPLPEETFKDDIDLSISSSELGFIGTAAAGGMTAIAEAISSGDITNLTGPLSNASNMSVSDITGVLSNMSIEQMVATGINIGGNLVRSLSKQIGWGASIDTYLGNIQNPYATAVFKGVSVQSKNLSWTLSPKSREESELLNKIVKKLKRSSLPEYSSVLGTDVGESTIDMSILNYPDLVDIFYTGIDQDHYIYHKTSMIKGVSVDYGPGGEFFAGERGSVPLSVKISIQLEELQIRTREDYEDDSD